MTDRDELPDPGPSGLPEAVGQAIDILMTIAEAVDGYRKNLIKMGFPTEQANLAAAQVLIGLQALAFTQSP